MTDERSGTTGGSAAVPDPLPAVPVLPVQVQAIRNGLSKLATISHLRSAHEALDALVAELSRLRANESRLVQGARLANVERERADRAEARVQTLTESLAFYSTTNVLIDCGDGRVVRERGKVAREALARVLVGGEPAGPENDSGGSTAARSGGEQR